MTKLQAETTLEGTSTRGVPFRITDDAFVPTGRYHDPGFYALETERLWRHVWQPACRLDEIPDAGDFVEYRILDQSFLIVRESDRSIRAFYNSCRHRATALGRGSGSFGTGQIVCPFHGWCWDLDGSNSYVYAREHFRPDCLSSGDTDLVSVPAGSRYGFVWINPDPDAERFDDWFRGIDRALAPARLDLMHVNWWHRVPMKANWKIAQEAFFEAYHVMQTHPEMAMHVRGDGVDPTTWTGYATDVQGHAWQTRTRRPTADRAEIIVGKTPAEFTINANKVMWDGARAGVMEWQVELADRIVARGVPYEQFFDVYWNEMYEEAARRKLPVPPLDPEMTSHCTVFPNFTLITMMGNALVYRSRPTGPDTCEYDFWSLSVRPEGTPATRPEEGTGVDWDDLWFVHQDVSNIERQQIGLHNVGMVAMRLAPALENMISNWHLALDERLA